jgi:hypothetical protein
MAGSHRATMNELVQIRHRWLRRVAGMSGGPQGSLGRTAPIASGVPGLGYLGPGSASLAPGRHVVSERCPPRVLAIVSLEPETCRAIGVPVAPERPETSTEGGKLRAPPFGMEPLQQP